MNDILMDKEGKEEIIRRYCQLSSMVWEFLDDPEGCVPLDCFCRKDIEDKYFRHTDEVYNFIEMVVKEQLNRIKDKREELNEMMNKGYKKEDGIDLQKHYRFGLPILDDDEH